jgi:hypothetical protein
MMFLLLEAIKALAGSGRPQYGARDLQIQPFAAKKLAERLRNSAPAVTRLDVDNGVSATNKYGDVQ